MLCEVEDEDEATEPKHPRVAHLWAVFVKQYNRQFSCATWEFESQLQLMTHDHCQALVCDGNESSRNSAVFGPQDAEYMDLAMFLSLSNLGGNFGGREFKLEFQSVPFQCRQGHQSFVEIS